MKITNRIRRKYEGMSDAAIIRNVELEREFRKDATNKVVCYALYAVVGILSVFTVASLVNMILNFA